MDAVSCTPTARVDGKGHALPSPFGPVSAPIYAMGTLGSLRQTRVCGHETAVVVPSTVVAEPPVGEPERGLQGLIHGAQNASLRALSGTTRRRERGCELVPPPADGIDYVRPRHAAHGSVRSTRDRASSGGRNVEQVGRRWHSRSRLERSRAALITWRRKVDGRVAVGGAGASDLFRRHSED